MIRVSTQRTPLSFSFSIHSCCSFSFSFVSLLFFAISLAHSLAFVSFSCSFVRSFAFNFLCLGFPFLSILSVPSVLVCPYRLGLVVNPTTRHSQMPALTLSELGQARRGLTVRSRRETSLSTPSRKQAPGNKSKTMTDKPRRMACRANLDMVGSSTDRVKAPTSSQTRKGPNNQEHNENLGCPVIQQQEVPGPPCAPAVRARRSKANYQGTRELLDGVKQAFLLRLSTSRQTQHFSTA